MPRQPFPQAQASSQFSHRCSEDLAMSCLFKASGGFSKQILDLTQSICGNSNSLHRSLLEYQQNIQFHGEVCSLTLVSSFPSFPKEGLFH